MTYKRLHENENDIYPSTSLCFYQPYIEKNFQRYGNNSVNATSYISFLKGGLWSEEFLNVDYDDVTLNFKDYLLGYEVYAKNFGTPRRYTFNEKQIEGGWTPPLNTYSSPDMKCFTVNIPFERE